MASTLTPKQQRFVREYLVDFNATQAAARAGYSTKTANEQGSQLLAKLSIQAEIQRLTKPIEKKLDISREWIMQELRYIAGARLPDHVRIETEPASRVIIHPLTGEPVTIAGGVFQSVRINDTKDLPEDMRAAISSIKQGANGIELKTYDKLRALELLGKAMGLFDAHEAPADTGNNLFEAIVESAQEELGIDDIPEIEQTPAAGNDVVEPPGVQKS